MTHTVIIGAGVAGLATATLLAREGHDVTVLERGSRVGGRAGIVERDGFRFDTGPSWYLMPGVFDHFFTLAGTSTGAELDLRMLDPGYAVFTPPRDTASGSPTPQRITVPHGRARSRELFEEREPGSGAEFDRYLDSAENALEMAERFFLYNPFTKLTSILHSDVLRSLGRLISLLTGNLHRFVGRRFRDTVLRQILEYPGIFLGTHPKLAPPIYHLMSNLDLDDGVRYPMGGFWRIIERLEALARDAGVTIITNADVKRIVCDDTPEHGRASTRTARVTGVIWRDTGEHAEEHGRSDRFEAADVVVSAADLHHTETQLIPKHLRTYPESWWKKRTSGPGAVIVLLGVRGELPELPHHSLLFTDDWHEHLDAITANIPDSVGDRSIYVCKPSATDDSVAPSGHENLFLLVPIPADITIGSGGADGTGDETVERIADAAIDQLSTWAGITDLHERIVVRETIGPKDFASNYHSWKGGMLGPAHITSQSAMFRAQNVSKRVRGLLYAGATTAPGVGVPMCLISAELVLKHIRGDASAGPSQLLPTEHTVNGSESQ